MIFYGSDIGIWHDIGIAKILAKMLAILFINAVQIIFENLLKLMCDMENKY